MVEQLICNQQVAGSSPISGSKYLGQMAEWLKATDCKSVLSRVRRFEPYSAHQILCRLHRTLCVRFEFEFFWIEQNAGVAHLVER